MTNNTKKPQETTGGSAALLPMPEPAACQFSPETLWTTRTLSEIRFGGTVSESKFEQDRYYKRGIPYITIGKKVLYREADVRKYLAENTIGAAS